MPRGEGMGREEFLYLTSCNDVYHAEIKVVIIKKSVLYTMTQKPYAWSHTQVNKLFIDIKRQKQEISEQTL